MKNKDKGMKTKVKQLKEKRQKQKQETKKRERARERLFLFFGRGTADSTVHFLSVGKEKVGGLLPSPLITLNDSNGPKTYL